MDFRLKDFEILSGLIWHIVVPAMRYIIEVVPRNMAGIDNMNLVINVSHLKTKVHWLELDRYFELDLLN
jgi:hypothetical protein